MAISIVSLLGLTFSAPATMRCDVEAFRHAFNEADEHFAWYDFWLDLDPAEAKAELGLHIWALRKLLDQIESPECLADRRIRVLDTSVRTALDNSLNRRVRMYSAERPW